MKLIKTIIINILYYFIPKKKYKILSDEKTIELINNGYSIARFGDGEFKWAFNIKQQSFQSDNQLLSNRLKEIMSQYNSSSNILLGIPYGLMDISQYTKRARRYWKAFYVKHHRIVNSFINDKLVYCNTNLTRPYFDYINKDEKIIRERFELIKKIWDKKDIYIIEGENTKLGVRNDLLNNVSSIKRIICPAINAFDKYEKILECAKKIPKNKTILISLGPTATVLAWDLSQEGYHAIDTGHIDIEYEWFISNAKDKNKVQGKAVNEAGTSNIKCEETDEDYLKSIIRRID